MVKKNFYFEIDKALREYENYKPYKQHTTEWICNRIDWCWYWKKITEEQMNELVDRIIAIMKEGA